MHKVKIAAALTAISAALALVFVATAGAPNRPPPNCPDGYTKDAASTDIAVLCTRTITNTVTVPGPERVVEVPGPERIVEKIVPGPERVVEKIVPGPERVVTKIVKVKSKPKVVVKTKVKRVVRWKERVIYVNCPVPGKG